MKTVLLQSSRLVSVVLFMLYGMSMFAQRQDILINILNHLKNIHLNIL